MKNTDTALGAFEAKNKFSELLKRVGRGAEFTITKHDRPVARLIPAVSRTKARRKKAAAELRAMSERYSLKGLSVRALRDEGRR
ncbi:MAG: prevent-host-death protein [Lacunisphaera sp.]|nr:prevent-host-death protein [Lacunisphaera sp.]